MPLYLISYDIADKDAFEYEPLWAKLRELNAVKILLSEWVIIANSAAAVYDKIAPLTSTEDKLLVQELGRDAAWDKLKISDDDFQEWLKYARF